MDKIYQITYRSTAQNGISRKEISALLDIAKARNPELGVTGCLVFHKGEFIQIIEGVKKNVFDLYHKIEKDMRHKNVSFIWEGSCAERVFPDWNMAFHETNVTSEGFRQFEKNLKFLSEFSVSPTAATGLFWHSVRKLVSNDRLAI